MFAAATVAGCTTNEPPSEEWRRAEQSIGREEMAFTNGMAWPASAPTNETVMSPGMHIKARAPGTEIIVEADRDYERLYTWDGGTRFAKLWPRKTRWHGNLGIYFPGVGQHWKPNGGITRGVLQEGVLWFRTTEDALNWINKVQALKNCVYSKDGLVVAWEKVLERKRLNVDVWQLMVAGRKPAAFPGSHDELMSTALH
jgi:hypothetical protein